MRGRGVCVAGGCAWQGGHVWQGGMHGRGACMVMVGGVHGRGSVHAMHAPQQILRDMVNEGQYASYWNAFLFSIV